MPAAGLVDYLDPALGAVLDRGVTGGKGLVKHGYSLVSWTLQKEGKTKDSREPPPQGKN